MGVEIERKFLVLGESWKQTWSCKKTIRQGYLNLNPKRTVRVRLVDDVAFLTIKGMSSGATRTEFEYPIPVHEAQELLQMCEGPLLEKERFMIHHEGLVWELDAFMGDNEGLVVAEVELSAEDEEIAFPAWVGVEVTGNPDYYNASLIQRPYTSWLDSSLSN